MSLKRPLEDLLNEKKTKQVKFDNNVKKHTLDSDEEDETDERYNVLDENDIEGEEEGSARQDGETRMTAFNMQEEMELGHFDKDGHFIWKNEKEVRDNWLDNIDWHKVKDKGEDPYALEGGGGLGDESDSESDMKNFNEIETYKKVVTYMQPKETINKTLRRLGGDTQKLSSVERLKRKKAGTLGSNKEVGELTELANNILTEMGNMDVYQETYEQIMKKIENYESKKKSSAKIVEAQFDMYADDFEEQVKKAKEKSVESEKTDEKKPELMWEFKWDQEKDEVQGPFNTHQMNKWANEGYFKTGVWVRKCGGTDSNFYSSNRIDFELYL